jgi:hypothetical protein
MRSRARYLGLLPPERFRPLRSLERLLRSHVFMPSITISCGRMRAAASLARRSASVGHGGGDLAAAIFRAAA